MYSIPEDIAASVLIRIRVKQLYSQNVYINYYEYNRVAMIEFYSRIIH